MIYIFLLKNIAFLLLIVYNKKKGDEKSDNAECKIDTRNLVGY